MFYKHSFSLLIPLPFLPSIPTTHVGYGFAIPKLKYNRALSKIRSFLVMIANMSYKLEGAFLVGESW